MIKSGNEMIQITIKKIYRKEGKTKAGKPYLLTKLLAEGRYYTTFSEAQQYKDLKEGMVVSLECEPASTSGYFNITKLITPNAAPASLPSQGKSPEIVPTFSKSSQAGAVNANPGKSKVVEDKVASAGEPIGSNEPALYLKENLKLVMEAYREQFGDLPEATGAPIIAEMLHVLSSYKISLRIEKAREERM